MVTVTRADGATRVEERLEYLRTPRGDLYTWAALPPSRERCVLFCSSILGDFTTNYHRERQMSRALSAMGWGAFRFHYAGEGNSGGERAAMTFESLLADARAAAEQARNLGFEQVLLLGTRVGALVAASLLNDASDGSPLALWEPVTDPLRFIKDGQRAKAIAQTTQQAGGGALDWRQELEQRGFLDLVGYDVYPALVNSFDGLNLIDLIGAPPREVFVARFGQRGSTNDQVADAMAAKGFSVRSGRYGDAESWFLQTEQVAEHGDLVSATTQWLSQVVSR